MNLDSFKNYLKTAEKITSQNTISNHYGNVKRFFRKYSAFNPETINAFMANMVDKKRSESTYNVMLCSLKHYAQFIGVEFPTNLKQKKIDKKIIVDNYEPLTNKEIEYNIIPYISLLFPHDHKKRIFLIRFMFQTGLRKSEIINLRKENILLSTNQVIVTNTKGKSDRIIFFHNNLKLDIIFYLEKTKKSAFGFSLSYIDYTYQIINKQLNYKKHITPHTLRHGYAKELERNGLSLTAIQHLLGHKSPITTQKYLKTSINELMELYRKGMKYKIGKEKK